MASQTDICNMALMRTGVSATINSITENSNEARVLRMFWDSMLDYALRDYPWNFTETRVSLALAEGNAPVNWAYKYVYPSDCLMAVAITVPGSRTPLASGRIPFKVAQEAGIGRVIYCDQELAEMVYRARITDTTQWDPMFVSCFADLLAAQICMPLSIDPKISAMLKQSYAVAASSAAARNMSEGCEGPEPQSEFVATRNLHDDRPGYYRG